MEREGKMRSKNLMTTETKKRLEKELEKAHNDLKESLLAIGEAAGPESDWHDNAAFDHAQMKYNLDSARANELQNKLQNIEIISPRTMTDIVEIGNTVLVHFEGMKREEKFTILGLDDSATRKGWVSYLAPLGKSLIGRKEGETTSFSVGDRDQKVEIIEILPGEFDEEGNS